MTKTDRYDLDMELVWLLRNNITDPKSRGSDATDTFSGNDSDTDFLLTNSGVTNVTSVKISSVSQSYGTDYTISRDRNGGTYTIQFTSAPAGGTNNIEIQYHYGSTWVYPDLPREDIKPSDYPRIGIHNISETAVEAGLNADMTRTSILKDIKVFARNTQQLRDLVDDVKDLIIDNKKNLYHTNLMTFVGMGPVIPEPNRSSSSHQIISQNVMAEMPFVYES